MDSISPGPVMLSALMDPDNHKETKLNPIEREEELQRYRAFPLYPTGTFSISFNLQPSRFTVLTYICKAFLLACNIVLEISGDTSAIQSHFDTSSTAASVSVGYGPFSIEPAVSTSDTNNNSTCETTSSGCRYVLVRRATVLKRIITLLHFDRITVKAPQIIGWISQMLPALPRKNQPTVATNSGATTRAVTIL